ncbi:hypothetical protein HYC85_016553 [Camellia sinensis]|uniref:Uncharacterized protein n=1 Tax=Camellia sinensis TaxID=4442 RepID=A0A7J7H1C6_CAMSI|nr:hypothetical protein HYC85_016553 [Camellia sinensis]
MFNRDSSKELAPSRADEVDDWGSTKRSDSRADESDSWVLNKSFVPSEGRRFENQRERRVGFESNGGADSENWVKKKDVDDVFDDVHNVMMFIRGLIRTLIRVNNVGDVVDVVDGDDVVDVANAHPILSDMAEAITTTKRQLASKGIIVVLTARDEKKGFEALEKLKSDGLSDHVVFCQLDVVDPSSVASLADFIKSKFGRLDILVNNAGIVGVTMDWDSLQSSDGSWEEVVSSWKKIMTPSYELGNECLQTNYYGTRRMIEALIPLLQLSDSPRILIPSEWAKGVLNDVESLTEERVEEVLNEFLKDFKEVSKVAINAYTRILAKKYPTFRINCVCPGWVKIDINNHIGKLTTEQGAQCPVKLALLPNDGPSGLFFINNEPTSFIKAKQRISPFVDDGYQHCNSQKDI